MSKANKDIPDEPKHLIQAQESLIEKQANIKE